MGESQMNAVVLSAVQALVCVQSVRQALENVTCSTVNSQQRVMCDRFQRLYGELEPIETKSV